MARYYTDNPERDAFWYTMDTEAHPIGECAVCGCDIYKTNDHFDFGGDLVCCESGHDCLAEYFKSDLVKGE